MCPNTIEGLPPGSGGPQEIAKSIGALKSLSPNNAIDAAAQEPIDRRTSLTGLSDAVRDVRIRLSLGDIWSALAPVSRHSDAAMLCLELEDFAGLEHHLRRVVDDVRLAAQKHKELRALLSEPGREAKQ
jgi:hypothetical protein